MQKKIVKGLHSCKKCCKNGQKLGKKISQTSVGTGVFCRVSWHEIQHIIFRPMCCNFLNCKVFYTCKLCWILYWNCLCNMLRNATLINTSDSDKVLIISKTIRISLNIIRTSSEPDFYLIRTSVQEMDPGH